LLPAVFVLGTVIPPLLPTVFVVSVGISAKRLSNRRISCTYPEGILVAGRVDMAFFDKTGTMTKQGMDFISAESSVPSDKKVATHISLGMAVCHTLTTASSGEMLGNRVDQLSFESTGAKLENKKGDQAARVIYDGRTYTILKKNEFDNHRVTQSVVIQDEKGVKHIFVKGSPEAIRWISTGSTVPANFETTVLEAAKSGVYQIAIAYKTFDFDGNLADVNRDDIEKSLTFGGFINFRNILREETAAVLSELEGGDVATAMITGDNALTGISIARESGMIKGNKKVVLGRIDDYDDVEWVDVDTQNIVDAPSKNSTSETDLAITGDAWNVLCNNDPKYVSLIAKQIRVFGRCNPSDKASVVSNFVEKGYTTLMCGDGNNDCGSLKSAHVGIALSSAEASIVAPFTSLDKTITSVTDVLREGRCALASAFSAYGYYIIYGQVESYLQTINAYLAITFTEWCWVFLDGIWSITMAFSLPLAKASNKLSPTRPTASLLGPTTISSLVGIIVWNLFYLVIGLVALWNQDWFSCRKWDSEDVSNILTIGDNYETTVLFLIGGYQYIASAIALNFGYTWRENWFKNYVFVFLATLFTVCQFVITIHPSEFSCIWRVNCDNDVSFS
jgi:predicted P-type ATPase